MWSLIHTMPDSSSPAIRSPRARSEVHTDAPSPKSESLASATASASESTTMIGSTGPKISSRMIRISCVTPVSTAGRVERAVEPRGRLDRAAAVQHSPGRHRVVDQLADDLELLARDHRPDLGVPAHRVAHAQPF